MKSWVVKVKRFGRRRCRFTCTTPDPDVHTNCACTCNINVIPPDGEKSIRYTRYWKPRLLHWIGNWNNNDELGHAVRFSGRRWWREIRTLTDLLLRNSLLSLFFLVFLPDGLSKRNPLTVIYACRTCMLGDQVERGCVHLLVEEALSLTLEISKSVDHYYHDDMKSRKKE